MQLFNRYMHHFLKQYGNLSKILFSFSFLGFLLLWSCSTQKNTLISRSYHNLTAHYNVYFNGNESFKKGVKTYEEKYRDDYSRLLPVFTYGNEELSKSISGEMDVAIKKATKLITLHSIKAKPEVKKGRLSANEKEFYNKSEYNNWVDDAYVLMGKSYFYEMDYDKATETFNFVLREFPKELAKYQGEIWLARINIEKGEYREADKILTQLASDKKFPKKLALLYYSTAAHLALKQEQYPNAIKNLEKALELVHQKKIKLRYLYILAQLYQQTKQNKKAVDFYTKVIRKNPPYEMTFNARINLAGMVEAGTKSGKDIKQQLKKMLRDDKNKDFLDQIYYALGNFEMKQGNEEKAIELYKLSVVKSTENNDQKGLSCLTLANYYYDHKLYVPAQVYYDSTVQYINPNYPNYELISAKAASLSRLVENLNNISREDSLQRVAKMTPQERQQFINKIINDLRAKEAQEQLAESQRLQEYYQNQARQNFTQGQSNTTAPKWYFYNPVSVSQGIKDFQLKWGKRKLEDNWQRRNKSISSFGPEVAENTGEKQTTAETKKIADNKDPQFYIQNLPLTDSLMQASTKLIIESYFNGGQVYRNELKDYKDATDLYEEMLKKYPDNDYKLAVYYQLYVMYTNMNETAKAQKYRDILVNQYPSTNYAQIITNPEFYKIAEEKDKQANRFYEQTYQYYQNGNYSAVITNASMAMQQYPGDAILPHFALLKALAIGKSGDLQAFRDELNLVIKLYPKHEVAGRARDIIAYMNTYKPETKQQEDIKTAEVIYNLDDKATYYFALVVPASEDANQLVFDIINFDLDHFQGQKFELTHEALGTNYQIITVHSFPEMNKANDYLNQFNTNTDVLKNLKSNVKFTFYISPENYNTLLKQNSPDSYIQYFKIHYSGDKTVQ